MSHLNRIAMDYARLFGGGLRGAEALARDLTIDDPDLFKAGYSIPNAVLAAAEAFDLDGDDRTELARRLDEDRLDEDWLDEWDGCPECGLLAIWKPKEEDDGDVS